VVAARPSFSDALERQVFVLDGAMGTQLYERGVLYSACFEELNVSRAELVQRVHSDYLAAGANVIETNTFGANALRLEKHGLSGQVRQLNRAGVQIARKAAGDAGYVFGAIGPSGYFLGKPTEEDLARVKAALFEQASALTEAEPDALILETFRQTNEIVLAVEAALEASGGRLPVIASVSLDEQGRMADGTGAEAIAVALKGLGVAAVGVNCSDGPQHVLSAVEQMVRVGIPILAAPNAGLPRRLDERLVYVTTPEYFGVYARRMYRVGVRLIGGCCGTTPEHVKRIAAAARMAQAADPSEVATEADDTRSSIAIESAVALPATPIAERSTLGGKLGKKFVVSVEVNPPVGVDLAKVIRAATELRDGGVDVINIADGARAQARMGNIAMAVRVQEQVGIETILHVCGRDRNLLGTLAHLLAAHELGLRNLVVITGDPPKMGDFPDASAVFDLDSIGMLKLASRLNVGIDPSGKPIGGATKFVLASGAEPASLNYDRELRRLHEKKTAGAEFIMTQPVYDTAVLDKFLDDIEPLGLPVLVGLLPLASFRNAEFLHNEVPGMQVPESVRERMRKSGTGAQARKEGVAIAREMLAHVRHRVAGAYVMPPLERHELALEVVDGFLAR
jgi:homocysteine S-methyltransferase